MKKVSDQTSEITKSKSKKADSQPTVKLQESKEVLARLLQAVERDLKSLRDEQSSPESADAFTQLVDSSFFERAASEPIRLRLNEILKTYRDDDVDRFNITDLQNNIVDRLTAPNPTVSYTALIAEGGRLKAAEKFGEEAIELVTASIAKNRDFVLHEGADVIFHLLVLLLSRGISIEEILEELYRRTNMSGLEEKASRQVK